MYIVYSKSNVPPKVVSPIPQEENRALKKPHANRGKSAVLTSSPYKDELETQQQTKAAAKMTKPENRKKKETPPKKKKKPLPKKFKIEDSSSSSSEEDVAPGDACIYCNSLGCKISDEGIIQCTKCKLFAHQACARAEELDQDFICDLCHVLLG